jgi:alpha-tubulin suppressor-like RCC1 family protein
LTNWLTVTGSYFSAAAVKTDGTLWTWGSNNYGQLGTGNITYYSSPKQVGALTNWLNVSGGNYFITALKTDGTLWAWGNNSFGQLGQGNQVNKSSPVQIGALGTWSNIACGTQFVLATRTNGSLYAWGFNGTGCLGNSTYQPYSSPIQVGLLTNWSLVSVMKSNSSCAIKTNGTLWTWGDNTYAQLAQGNTTTISSPKQVGSLTTWNKLPYSNFSDTVLALG